MCVTDTIIGIDLGTTNSEVAVVRQGRPQVIEIEGSRLLPSVVGISDGGELLVGQAARNQYGLRPERTVRSIKRRMGEEEKVALAGQTYTPQEISALILRRLKQAAEAELGEAVGRAVITVPAYFSDAQRQATRDAGELAGLEVVRIINEPTAASLAYQTGGEARRTTLVYDLGGGTFDVSVLRQEADVTEVLASHGNRHLGGDDFDDKIVEHLVAHLRSEADVDPTGDARAMARIGRAAEAAKIALTDAPYARIEEEYLMETDQGPVHLSLELARSDYEALIEPYVAETLEAVHVALDGAGLAVSDVDEVLLVGGSTRTPVIQQRLEAELRRQPRAEIDPDLCVAEGAAIQAATVAGQRVSGVLVDVTPYTFGTSAISELNGELYPYTFIPLIRKNTPIPVTKSEAFQTVHDGQTEIDVTVYQGEDPDALNNTEIGAFRVEGLSDVPAGNIIVSTFSLDLDGILHVTAREKRTGLERRISIDNATARFEQDEMAAARDRLQALTGETAGQGDTGPEGELERRAEELIGQAQRLMETVDAEDREDLVNMVETVREAMTKGDAQGVQKAADELSEMIFYLEA